MGKFIGLKLPSCRFPSPRIIKIITMYSAIPRKNSANIFRLLSPAPRGLKQNSVHYSVPKMENHAQRQKKPRRAGKSPVQRG